MVRTNKLVSLAALSFALMSANTSQADSIFSTLEGATTLSGASGPGGNTIQPANGSALASGSPITTTVGYAFTSATNASVSQLDLALLTLPYYTNLNGANPYGLPNGGAVTVSLWSSTPWQANGDPQVFGYGAPSPGTELGSWNVLAGGYNDPNNIYSFSNALTTISGITNINLAAGKTYELLITPNSYNTAVEWSGPAQPTLTYQQDLWLCSSQLNTNTGVVGSGCGAQVNTGSRGYAAFDVVGTTSPVPIPATAWLMVSGLGSLWAVARKRRAV